MATDGIKISQLPQATAAGPDDIFPGVQNGTTKKFKLSTILNWIKSVLTAADLGAQATITASGILKGDGAGGVSAAAAGTDYQAPLVAGTDYATPAMIPSVPDPSDAAPQALGTAAAGSSGDYSRADHVHGMPTASDVGALASDGTAAAAYRLEQTHEVTGEAGWYQFAQISVSTAGSRTIDMIVSNTYARTWGLLHVFENTNSSGVITSMVVRWITTTFDSADVRWAVANGVLALYIRKSSNTAGRLLFTLLDSYDRDGAYQSGMVTWDDTSVTEPAAATAAEADANAQAAQLAKVLGDPAGVNAAVGEYVSYNGELYTVNTAITSDMAASVFASYLDTVPDGGLNALNNQTLDGVYSCYGYRADLISSVDVQLKKDYVTDGTTYRIFAPLYLIDFNNPQTVDEYYLMLDQNNPSRFVRITSNNSTRNITATAFDPSTGVLTLTLNGTRRYVGADVRIAKQLI